MKAFKSIKIVALSISLMAIALVVSTVHAQEYDDMYFNKSDRKTVKVDKLASASDINRKELNDEARNLTKSTAQYSSKNINPEYIARYKSSESNEVNEAELGNSGQDYFIENYDQEYVGDPNKNQINYAALNKRDQMSYSNYNRPYSSPSWRFSPYMSMGMMYGSPYYGGYGYSPFGYDPYMMGSGMTMGVGFGSGFGYGPTMSYNIGMSWGSGYNPWGGWGGYPGYYSPYGMGGFYDPWGPSFGYNPYSIRNSWYRNNYFAGGFYPTVLVTSTSAGGSEYINGRNVQYTSRSSRSSATPQYTRSRTGEQVRVASSDAKIRVPGRTVSTSSVSNGRTSRDYSKVQNEYYNTARRNSASRERISNSNNNRSTYGRNVNSSSRFNTSSVTRNKPSRTSGYTSGYNRSSMNSRSSSFTGNRGSSGRSSSSYSSPGRSSSSSFSGRSYSSGSSSRTSSYSSGGSRSSSSSGTRSSGSSRGGRQ